MKSSSDRERAILKRYDIAREILVALLRPYFGMESDQLAAKLCFVLFYPRHRQSIVPWSPETALEKAPFEFGVSEFSLSFVSGRPAELRCLAEVVSRCGLTEENLLKALEIGRGIFELLACESGVAYDFNTFSSIFRLAYPATGHFKQDRDFRMGLALGFAPGHPIALKTYLDLRAEGQHCALAKADEAFKSLELPGQDKLTALTRLLGGTRLIRGMGMDFSPQHSRNLRVYLLGQQLTRMKLHRLLTEAGLDNGIEHLTLFNHLVLNDLEEFPPHPMLVSVGFSERLPHGKPIIKWDVFLPPWYPDDETCFDMVRQLLSAFDLDWSAYEQVASIVAASQPLERLRCVHQYLSIDFLPNGQAKVNVYFRPVGLETSHMDPHYRPRLVTYSPAEEQRVETIRRTISFLEGQRSVAYPELVHRMAFPSKGGFGGPLEQHKGLVFQLALICDALIHAKQAGLVVDAIGLARDIQTLVEARCRDVQGGWKYFPTLRELPPDADDLGQILQVLVQSGWSKVSELCDPAIELLFEQGSHSEGSLETWIVDRDDPSSHTQAMLDAIATHWGSGPDVEVMANMLYGLYLYDASRFRVRIEKGLEVVTTMQQAGGHWISTWYTGLFYGTYVCTRLIGAVKPSHPALARVAGFLKSSQTKAGGWGVGTGNPTDTALGLLTLTALVEAEAHMDPVVADRAVAFLEKRQLGDGRWEATPFIQMDTNRALSSIGLAQPRIITYSSSTLTSALCLKALSHYAQICSATGDHSVNLART